MFLTFYTDMSLRKRRPWGGKLTLIEKNSYERELMDCGGAFVISPAGRL